MIIEVNVFQESLATITTTVPHSKQFEILARKKKSTVMIMIPNGFLFEVAISYLIHGNMQWISEACLWSRSQFLKCFVL